LCTAFVKILQWSTITLGIKVCDKAWGKGKDQEIKERTFAVLRNKKKPTF
jgi:hypothetical protein